MIHSDLKKHYSCFLKGHGTNLHLAAHSHHFWPDVTREAQIEYWDDCAKTSDEKWNKIFSQIIPKTQKHIAKILNLKDEQQIAFAPNTHELTSRLLSLFLGKSALSVLTTTSEFHSWKRQILRLKELPEVSLTTVTTDLLLSDRRAFLDDLKNKLKNSPDIFFISQVFFDSGLALTDSELMELLEAKSSTTLMVVDGYHAFAALPTNLGPFEGKIFYLGGGYKYAQGGEGSAFMVIPKGEWRPAYTGWFAEYAHLSHNPGSEVGYSSDGMAFMGSTQDPSGLYRFNATWDLFEKLGLTVPSIHAHVKALQEEFIRVMPKSFLQRFNLTPLFKDLDWHGHFLTYSTRNPEEGEVIQQILRDKGILNDRRGNRLRFGLGLYHNQADIQNFQERLKKLAVG